jgi:hypothetical protein
MKTKVLFSLIASLALSASISTTAQAVMIAGWDFSQYYGPGELSIDGASYTNVLSANYSNLDLTFGAGAESANFGTLFFDGTHGSTLVDPTSATSQLTPTSGSLASNINAPVPPQGTGANPFDSFQILQSEGQTFANELSLKAASAANFVFGAYLNTVPGLGSNWAVSFGGQTSSGTSVVLIDFSTDGSNFTNIGSRTLTSVDTQFTVNLGTGPSKTGYVRFGVTPSGADTRFDNVAMNGTIVVPEPGTIVLLGSALAAFGLLGRRRA